MNQNNSQKRNKTVQKALGEMKRWHNANATIATTAKVSGDLGNKIVLGVSGGADSLALAYITSAFYQQYNIVAVIVDHCLQKDSGLVASNAADEVSKLGIKCIIKQANIIGTDNLEAKARNARYNLLLSECESGDILLLAHTQDDLAETVLLNIARGSGTHALTGMGEAVLTDKNVIIGRPFLKNITRKMTEEICKIAKLEYWNDPTNFLTDNCSQSNIKQPDTPMRTIVRHKLLPVYEEIFPGIKKNLARTALLSANDDDYLDKMATDIYSKVISDKHINRHLLKNEHVAIRYRVIKHWLESLDYPHQITFERIREIDEKLIILTGKGGKTIELDGGYNVVREEALICLLKS